MIRLLSLLVCVGLLFGLMGCDNVDITKVQNLLNPPRPVGEFEGDWWLDLTSAVYFGELRVEEREDGIYFVAPAGALTEGTLKMTFQDGTVLNGHVAMTWDDGGLVQKVLEVDPDTGAPLKTLSTGSFPWQLYSETGEVLFLATGVIQERYMYWENGQIVSQEDVQPALLRGVGVGLYQGYVFTSDGYVSREIRDGVPGLAWSGPGLIEKAQ